jgi:hypothetical protein
MYTQFSAPYSFIYNSVFLYPETKYRLSNTLASPLARKVRLHKLKGILLLPFRAGTLSFAKCIRMNVYYSVISWIVCEIQWADSFRGVACDSMDSPWKVKSHAYGSYATSWIVYARSSSTNCHGIAYNPWNRIL